MGRRPPESSGHQRATPMSLIRNILSRAGHTRGPLRRTPLSGNLLCDNNFFNTPPAAHLGAR